MVTYIESPLSRRSDLCAQGLRKDYAKMGTQNRWPPGLGDGRVAHSVGDCVVEVPMGSRTISHPFYVMDTEAFNFVMGTDFLTQYPEILSRTLRSPYMLWVDHGGGRVAVSLDHADTSSRHLRVMKQGSSNLSQEEAVYVGER